MNKSFIIILVSCFVMLSMVSAVPACFNQTVITGTVFFGNNLSDFSQDAVVEVYCNSNLISELNTNETGVYKAWFLDEQCPFGSEVTVKAQKNGLTNEVSGIVSNRSFSDNTIFPLDCGSILNVGIVDVSLQTNVPLIPEFSLLVGGITIICALIALAIIRRN